MVINLLSVSFGVNSQKKASPSFEKILFLRTLGNVGNYYSEIWLVNRDGTNCRRIYTHPSYINLATWSNDNKSIYFYDNKGLRLLDLGKSVSKSIGGFPIRMPPIVNCSADAKVCVIVEGGVMGDEEKRIRICRREGELVIKGAGDPSFTQGKQQMSDKVFLTRFASNMAGREVRVHKMKIEKDWAAIAFEKEGNQYYKFFIFAFYKAGGHWNLFAKGWLGEEMRGIWGGGQWITFFKEKYPPKWVNSFFLDEGGM